jgi:hypothetical protein
MDAKGGFTRIRAKTPRCIALIACLAAAFTISACGGDNSGTPATPVLTGVLVDGSCAEAPASTGEFRVLPTEKVRVRVAAAWPSADLVVKANGAELEKVIPSDTGRQSDLRAAGTAYWVPENIDPNLSPPTWTVGVTLPPSMRAGPLKLELTSRTPGGDSSSPLTVDLAKDDVNPSGGGGMVMHAAAPEWNRVELDWRDRGDELGYLLERSESGGPFTGLVSIGTGGSAYTDTNVKGETKYSYRLTAQGCGPSFPPGGPRTGSSTSEAEVTTPREPAAAPKTCDDTITLSRNTTDPNADPFLYTNPNNIFLPEDAVVTSVTNVAQDVNNHVAVPMGSVKHTDANGVMRELTSPTGCPLAAGGSTAQFDGQTVEGEWIVHVGCTSNTSLLDHIALKISWQVP